jgi:hypothetical protein
MLLDGRLSSRPTRAAMELANTTGAVSNMPIQSALLYFIFLFLFSIDLRAGIPSWPTRSYFVGKWSYSIKTACWRWGAASWQQLRSTSGRHTSVEFSLVGYFGLDVVYIFFSHSFRFKIILSFFSFFPLSFRLLKQTTTAMYIERKRRRSLASGRQSQLVSRLRWQQQTRTSLFPPTPRGKHKFICLVYWPTVANTVQCR